MSQSRYQKNLEPSGNGTPSNYASDNSHNSWTKEKLFSFEVLAGASFILILWLSILSASNFSKASKNDLFDQIEQLKLKLEALETAQTKTQKDMTGRFSLVNTEVEAINTRINNMGSRDLEKTLKTIRILQSEVVTLPTEISHIKENEIRSFDKKIEELNSRVSNLPQVIDDLKDGELLKFKRKIDTLDADIQGLPAKVDQERERQIGFFKNDLKKLDSEAKKTLIELEEGIKTIQMKAFEVHKDIKNQSSNLVDQLKDQERKAASMSSKIIGDFKLEVDLLEKDGNSKLLSYRSRILAETSTLKQTISDLDWKLQKIEKTASEISERLSSKQITYLERTVESLRSDLAAISARIVALSQPKNEISDDVRAQLESLNKKADDSNDANNAQESKRMNNDL